MRRKTVRIRVDEDFYDLLSEMKQDGISFPMLTRTITAEFWRRKIEKKR